MRAAVFGESGQISLQERSLSAPRPGWVRVAVGAVGICGSDLNLLYAHGDQSRGVQPGHEVAGVVEAVGDDVALETGTRVALEPLVGCGVCSQCRRGAHNLCPTLKLFGFTGPGGMAELVNVPADALYVLPPHLSANAGALIEPMAVCVRGVRLAGIELGETVAVVGCGSIGLLSIVAARAAGAGDILVTARHPHQREMARSLGAAGIFDDARALVREVGDQHVDVVVETVGGRAQTLTEAVHVVRNGGRIVMLGVFEGASKIPAFDFFRKELTLSASNCYGRERRLGDFALATRLLDGHHAELEPLITHRFKLDQVGEAFAAAADKKTHSIKVQVEP